MTAKQALYQLGAMRVKAFCERNQLPIPTITHVARSEWRFDACAYYRPDDGIMICIDKCAHPGTAGRAWSWPGYSVDRTPYGVLAHELGHHVDVQMGLRMRDEVQPGGGVIGPYWSTWGKAIHTSSQEAPLTSYCPNTAEWTAEMLRLFITNYDLLRCIRPLTHTELMRAGLKPLQSALTWDAVLRQHAAPERHMQAARNKVNDAS